jgi:hypothetical protein
MRMSKHRVQVREYISVYTPESIENGCTDRTYLDNEQVFNSLSDFASYLVGSILVRWVSSPGNGGMYSEVYMSDYYTAEEEERYLCWNIGQGLDTPTNRAAIKIFVNRALERKKASKSLIEAFNSSF